MNKTYNKTIIIGRLGNDPEFHTGGNVDYCKFTLSNSTIKDGVEEVQWHHIVSFGKQAKVCTENLRKGDLCCIEGRLTAKRTKRTANVITVPLVLPQDLHHR